MTAVSAPRFADCFSPGMLAPSPAMSSPAWIFLKPGFALYWSSAATIVTVMAQK